MRRFKLRSPITKRGDGVAKNIANGILKIQARFANYLKHITKKWKPKHQWIFLYFICTVFGTLSMLAILQPFKTNEPASVIIIKSIRVPKSINQGNKAFLITKRELDQVREYKAKHPDLIKARPALYDSLSLIEESYYSQQK